MIEFNKNSIIVWIAEIILLMCPANQLITVEWINLLKIRGINLKWTAQLKKQKNQKFIHIETLVWIIAIAEEVSNTQQWKRSQRERARMLQALETGLNRMNKVTTAYHLEWIIHINNGRDQIMNLIICKVSADKWTISHKSIAIILISPMKTNNMSNNLTQK